MAQETLTSKSALCASVEGHHERTLKDSVATNSILAVSPVATLLKGSKCLGSLVNFNGCPVDYLGRLWRQDLNAGELFAAHSACFFQHGKGKGLDNCGAERSSVVVP